MIKHKLMKKITMIFLFILVMGNLTVLYANSGSNIEWNGRGSIEVVGYGYPPTNSIGGQAKILARRAAIVDGYRNLAELVAGVNVDATTTVSGLQVESDIVKTKVSAVIKNARIVSETFNSDGAYQVVMSIPLFGENSLATAVISTLAEQVEKVDFPKPAISTVEKRDLPKQPSTYSGVIIDCSGLPEINRVMSPVILNEKREPIYGHQFLDTDFIIKNGMVDYVTDATTSSVRAGSSPLVLKAIALDKHNSAPVLSEADASLLLSLNQGNQGFLRSAAVVFKQSGVQNE